MTRCDKVTLASWTSLIIIACTSQLLVSYGSSAEIRSGGLDTLLLIDVSESMTLELEQQRAGDKEGVRWDAANLIADLATVEDRVGLITFGGEIQPRRLSGGEVLIPMTEQNRKAFKEGLSSQDNGGTPIMDTLDEASRILQVERPAEEGLRPGLVVLLTDGKETIQLDAAGKSELLRAHVEYFLRNEIPVHVIGLGKQVDEFMLNRIAHFTRGSYRHISSNAELLRAMQDIHWAAKQLWVKPALHVIAQENSPATVQGGSVTGIVDLGILVQSQGGVPPREARAPRFPPLVDWRDAEGRPFPVTFAPQIRSHETYWFSYFGPNDGRLSPLASIPAGGGPEMRVSASGQHSIVFLKRTAAPLFHVDLPGVEAKFRFGEPITTRVSFFSQQAFSPNDFQLVAELKSADGSGTPLTATLQWDAESKTFSHAWVVDPQQPTLGEGYHNVTVTAVGLRGPLTDYRLDLARRTIYFGGKIGIDVAPPDLVLNLNKANNFRDIVLLKADTKASFPVQCELQPPFLDGKAIGPAELFNIKPAPASFQDGKLTLELLWPQKAVAGGLPYGKALEPGYIVVGGPYVSKPVRVPFRFSLGLFSVTLSPERIPALTAPARDRPVYSVPLKLLPMANVVPNAPGLKCQVSVVTPQGLTPAEVGLVKGENDAPQARLNLALGDPFFVWFRAASGRQDGMYTGQLQIGGPEIEPLTYPATLLLNVPLVEISDVPVQVFAGRGQTVRASLAATLQGGCEKLPVTVRPRQNAGNRVVFQTAANQVQPLEVRTANQTQPLELSLGRPTAVPVEISVPEDASCGEYTAEFSVEGPNLEPLPFQVQLAVNALRIERKDRISPTAGPTWMAVNETGTFATMGDSTQLPLRVIDELGKGVRLDDLEKRVGNPVNKLGHVLNPPRISEDPASGILTLEFQIPERAFAQDEYYLDFQVTDRNNPYLKAKLRIRLVVAEQATELRPHNPVTFRFPILSVVSGAAEARSTFVFEGGNSDATQHNDHRITTPSPEWLDWKIETAPLQRQGGGAEDQIPAKNLRVESPNNNPVRNDHPVEVQFVVTPGKVRPGRYVGVFQQMTWRTEPRKDYPKQSIEVRVDVAGREVGIPKLVSVGEAPKDTAGRRSAIYAHHPLFLEFDLDCMLCGPGEGKITLTGPPSGAANDASPAPVEIPVLGQEMGRKVSAKDGSGLDRYHVRVAVPVERVGHYQLSLDWQSGFGGGGDWVPEERLQHRLAFDALPAIAVSERFPYVYEEVTVQVACSPKDDAPDGLHITASGPEGADSIAAVDLFLSDDGDIERFRDEFACDGIYSSPYQVLEKGRFAFTVDTDNPLGTAFAPAKIEAAFEIGGTLGVTPDHKVQGVDRRLPRGADLAQGFQFPLMTNILSITSSLPNVRWTVRLVGDPASDVANKPAVALSQAGSQMDPAKGLEASGELQQDETAILDMVVSLPKTDDPEAAVWRGVYDYTAVIELSGSDANGVPVRRSIEIPFTLSISSEANWTLIIAIAGVAVGVGILLAGARWFSRRNQGGEAMFDAKAV